MEETHKAVRLMTESARVRKELLCQAMQQVKEIMGREVASLSMEKLLMSTSHKYVCPICIMSTAKET